MGINTYKPRTENYVLDVNGSMHLGNGEINTIADNTYEITHMDFAKTNPEYGIAVGSPSTKSGSEDDEFGNTIVIAEYNQFLLYTSDGGKTWTKGDIFSNTSTSTETSITVRHVHVFNNEYSAIAASNSYLFLSKNAGANWYRLQLQNLTVDFQTIIILNHNKPLVTTPNALNDSANSSPNGLAGAIDANTYTGLVPTTSGNGTGTILTIVASVVNSPQPPEITSVIVTTAGTGYIAGDTLIIAGETSAGAGDGQLPGRAADLVFTLTAEDITTNTHRILISSVNDIYHFDCDLADLFDNAISYYINILSADINTTTLASFSSASSTSTFVYYAGDSGITRCKYSDLTEPFSNNIDHLSKYNNIYALDDSNAIAVGNNIISYTTDGTGWTHKIITTNLGLPNMVLNSVFIQSSSNAIAVGSSGAIIFSTDWQNGIWQMVPDNLLNSSGTGDRIRGTENNLKSISIPDLNTMIIADVIDEFVGDSSNFNNTILGYSKIQYCFLPNLFNRDNNTVFDVSGNSMFDGHITGQATLVINDGNANTFTVSNDAVNANTKAITLTTTDALTLTDGSVNFIMDGIGATSLRGATTFDLDASGIISINSTDGAINIGDDANTGAINIGTGESARTITVGNATGITKLDINSGTDGINIDTTGHVSIDASGHISIDAGNAIYDSVDGTRPYSKSIDIGKKTHIIEIGKTD